MNRVLLTGMSGAGKSSALSLLAELGYRTIDTDCDGLTVEVRSASGTERLWRENRIQEILSATEADVIFISGTCRNQVKFYPQFDHIVLLSAPASVLVQRHAIEQSLWEGAGTPCGNAALRRDGRTVAARRGHAGN